MIGWIRRIFCTHKWEEVYREKANWNGEVRSGTWTSILFKCDKCGNMKKVMM